MDTKVQNERAVNKFHVNEHITADAHLSHRHSHVGRAVSEKKTVLNLTCTVAPPSPPARGRRQRVKQKRTGVLYRVPRTQKFPCIFDMKIRIWASTGDYRACRSLEGRL